MIQSARCDIRRLYFLGVTGAVTVTGHFADEYGDMIGTSFTYNIPAGDGVNDPVSLATVAGLAIPGNADRVRLVITGNVYWAAIKDATASQIADFKANYVRYPAEIAATPSYNGFGKGKDW